MYVKVSNPWHRFILSLQRLLLFSCWVTSDSLQPQGLQHSRLCCPPVHPGVCPNSCPLSRWCHPTISSPWPQSLPASVSFCSPKATVLFPSPLSKQLTWISFSFFFSSFIFISRGLITSQHCSGFCHTLTWISHGVTCIPHPDPPSPLPLHPIPLGLPSAPGSSTCLMHPT